jgi:hypothetical protein
LDNHDENEDYIDTERLAPGRQIRAASAMSSVGTEKRTNGNLFGFSRTKQGRSGSRLDTGSSAGEIRE